MSGIKIKRETDESSLMGFYLNIVVLWLDARVPQTKQYLCIYYLYHSCSAFFAVVVIVVVVQTDTLLLC